MDSVKLLLIQGMTQEWRLPKNVQIPLTPHHTLSLFLSTQLFMRLVQMKLIQELFWAKE